MEASFLQVALVLSGLVNILMAAFLGWLVKSVNSLGKDMATVKTDMEWLKKVREQ